MHALQGLHAQLACQPGGLVGGVRDGRRLDWGPDGGHEHGCHVRSLYDASAVNGAGGEYGVEVAAGVEFGVGLDGGHADDARPGLVQGDQLERCVSGVELSGPVVVVRQHQVGGAGVYMGGSLDE